MAELAKRERCPCSFNFPKTRLLRLTAAVMKQQFAIGEGEEKSTEGGASPSTYSPRFMRASDIINCRREKHDTLCLVWQGEGGRETGSRDWKWCVQVCLCALARHERMTGRKIHTSWQLRNCTCKVETRERRRRTILPS